MEIPGSDSLANTFDKSVARRRASTAKRKIQNQFRATFRVREAHLNRPQAVEALRAHQRAAACAYISQRHGLCDAESCTFGTRSGRQPKGGTTFLRSSNASDPSTPDRKST